MTATAAHVPLRTIRRRRLFAGAALVVLAILIGDVAGAPVTARLFDVGVALAAVAAGWALARDLRAPRPAAPIVHRSRPRVATVARSARVGRAVLADAA